MGTAVFCHTFSPVFKLHKKRRDLCGPRLVESFFTVCFYSAQVILLSQLRRGLLAKKEVKAKKLIH